MINNIENDFLKVTSSDSGGHIESIYNKKTGIEHIWPYNESVWPRRTSICFPICGRLIDDEYIHEGKTYHMPMHGFLREKRLETVKTAENSVLYTLEHDRYTWELYPFNFLFSIHIRLDGNTVIIKYHVKNTDSKTLLYSLGTHYAFSSILDACSSINEYVAFFQKPITAEAYILSNGLILGSTRERLNETRMIRVKDLVSEGTLMFSLTEASIKTIGYGLPDSPHSTSVTAEGFPHAVLWSPNSSIPFFCIETWHGLPDSATHNKVLAQKPSVLTLDPGMYREHTLTIKVF